MSSTDLADEQTKHNIEVLEKEALEHSILQKVTAPRAKITHKGYETIEDVTGTRTTDTAREEEEQRMAMEKRERERLARLRAVSQSGQEGSPITPVDPSLNQTSPTISTPSWGAPPPVPSEVAQSPVTVDQPAVAVRLAPRPLFVPTASDFTSGDQGLDLADLIHIDEDMPPSRCTTVLKSPRANERTVDGQHKHRCTDSRNYFWSVAVCAGEASGIANASIL